MITYEIARNYKIGEKVRLDLNPFNKEMVSCLNDEILSKNHLISGLKYRIVNVEDHKVRDPFVVFEIENEDNGKRVKLGSHLFSKVK